MHSRAPARAAWAALQPCGARTRARARPAALPRCSLSVRAPLHPTQAVIYIQADPSLWDACKEDAGSVCKGVKDGGGRIQECLVGGLGTNPPLECAPRT